jgi:hypothetical protein
VLSHLKFEPVLAAGTVQAVLALVFHLSAGVTGGIKAAAAALLALLTASAHPRPGHGSCRVTIGQGKTFSRPGLS